MAKKKAEKAAGEGAEAVSFEKQLARLEEIVEKLEGDMPGLDESIKLYEEGVKSLKACQQKLAEAEARIKMLVEGKGGPELEDFDAEQAREAEGDQQEADDTPSPRRRRGARKPRGRGLF
jgi:exodeoxyribonuclease VII small subunit